MTGLLFALVSEGVRARPVERGFSNWIEIYLPENAPESVALALELADQSEAKSLDAWLDAFFVALDATGATGDAAAWLYGDASETAMLQQDLRLRFMDAVSMSVIPRSMSADRLKESTSPTTRPGGADPHGLSNSHFPSELAAEGLVIAAEVFAPSASSVLPQSVRGP